MTQSVVVVDSGVGNILSIMRGLEKVGAQPQLSSQPEQLRQADRLILPGVGAFESGMAGLARQGLDQAIKEFAASGKPVMGICLGMQMLFDRSAEHGEHAGLGLIPGQVVQIPTAETRKIPHIGWSALALPEHRSDWRRSMLQSIVPGDFLYFVHSFMAVATQPTDVLAVCDYTGQRITACVVRDNVMGCQFHPEKSGEVGLRILQAFLLMGL